MKKALTALGLLALFNLAAGQQMLNVTATGVGIGTSSPAAKLSVNGTTQILNGDSANSAYNAANLAFGYHGGPDYQHFLQTRHDSATGGIGNALVLWLNNSVSAVGSSQPGTGNSKAFDLAPTILSFIPTTATSACASPTRVMSASAPPALDISWTWKAEARC